ncbi:MAG: response regulator [Candidatus Aminicenantes bacterium]|nr:response regulator [Candidatus Aminicenantes bacterium]
MRVFIIDDYLDFACPLKDNFAFKGHTADYCIDSNNAVQAALKFRPDWVVIDFRMPYKNGVEVFKELQEKADFEFSAIFYSLYLQDPVVMEEINKLGVADEAMVAKTTDLDRDVTEKIIPVLEAGYLKGGKDHANR